MLFLHFRLSEQAEVHAAVCPVLNESGHILKTVVLAVFEYEDAVGLQQSALKYQLGQGGQLGKSVGRIGKDEVELLVTALYKAEHVAAQGDTFVCPQLFNALLYEGVMVAVGFNAYHALTSPRQHFERYAARA